MSFPLSPLHPIRIVAVDGKENASLAEHAFVPFGFVLRQAHAYQRANNAAHHAAGADAAKGSHDWASCGPTPGMASAPTPACNPRVPPMIPPAVTPEAVPPGAFVCVSVVKSFDPPVFAKQNGDMLVRVAGLPQCAHNLLCAVTCTIDPKYRGILPCHIFSPLFSQSV